jgi:hypothetical protein
MSGSPGIYPIHTSFGLNHKHWTRLEKPASVKASSPFQKFVNYIHTTADNISPWDHIHNTSFFS